LPANDDLALLIDAARAAGEIALGYWRQAPESWEKDDGAGPVTEADLAVNAMLHDRLMGARPGYGWLSEETPDDPARLAAGRCFIVDPIDGTRAFIDGTPDFAHSIAIADQGIVTAGVVFLPAQDRLYSARKGAQVELNGAPIHASAATSLTDATLLTARSTLAAEHWRDGRVPPVERKFRSSLAWRLCLVAEGAFDAMMTLMPTWEWDVAAGSLIASSAGATVSDRHGQPLRFNAADPRLEGCIVAPPALHTGLLAALK